MKQLLLILLLAVTACSKQVDTKPPTSTPAVLYHFNATQQTGSVLCQVTVIRPYQGDTFYLFELAFTDGSVQKVQVKVQVNASAGSWAYPTAKILKSWKIVGS